jgi:hypothetical protein
MSDENTLRSQLWASFRSRAQVHLEVYRVLGEELGEDRATELLQNPIYRRGCDIGRRHLFIEKGV